MKILICIDDTDDLTKETSTGKIANNIKKKMEKEFSAKCEDITRHQLLIHEDVPYTSHNSSMCFRADIKKEDYEKIIITSKEIIKNNMAESSDPGLCISIEDDLEDKELLIDYGFLTKRKVIKKEDAYALAKRLGVFLDELGGTGQGVIGALAGVGLRLSGNDGEFRGSIDLEDGKSSIKVVEIKELYSVDEVRTLDGKIVGDNEDVIFKGKNKIILMDNKRIFYVEEQIEYGKNTYVAVSKDEIRNMDFVNQKISLDLDVETISKFTEKANQCSYYEKDVEEELVVDIQKNCLNCLYRIWENKGIRCHKPEGDIIV